MEKIIITLFIGLIFISGCSSDKSTATAPRLRLGSYATDTPGARFLDTDHLGKHSYGFVFSSEKNGIAYTCRGGHIDVTHVRINADYTRYLYYKVKKNLTNDKTDFTFKLNVEPSNYYVHLTYPADWETKSPEEKQEIINDVSIELSQYFVFSMTTWHEILTWFGYKCMAIVPEQPSAFSWEDIYSNLLGTRIGIKAVLDDNLSYDTALTKALKEEMQILGGVSAKEARSATAKMRGIWWKGAFIVDMKARNFDIGQYNGYVTPFIVPGFCKDAEPQSYPAPKLEKFNDYGFKMKLEVEPKEFESGQIMDVIHPHNHPKRLEPGQDIPIIVEYIKNLHEQKYARQKKTDVHALER